MPEIQTIASILTAPQQQSTYLTDEEKKRILAFQELQRMAGSTNTPIYSKGTGLLKVATGALGGFLEGKAERDAAAAQAQNSALVNQYLGMFGGIDPNAAPPPLPPPPAPSVGGGGPDMGMPGIGGANPAPAPPPPVDIPAPPPPAIDVPGMGTPGVTAPPVEMSSIPQIPGTQVAEPFHHVADAPRIVPIPSPPPVDGQPAVAPPTAPPEAVPILPADPGTPVSPMAPAVMPGDMDKGMLFNPQTPQGLSEGATVLPNAAVKPVPFGPNGEVSSLDPSSPMANDQIPRPPADIPNANDLGSLSAKYESGGNIASAHKDNIGWAYGKWQFNSKGNLPEFFARYPGYAKSFAGLTPGTEAFNDRWRMIARNDPQGFEAAQREHATHELEKPGGPMETAAQLGFKTNNRGIYEALWSGTQQHGGIKKVLAAAAQAPGFANMAPEDQVKAFYSARMQYVQNLQARGIPGLEGQPARYRDELNDATRLARAGSLDPSSGAGAHPVSSQMPADAAQPRSGPSPQRLAQVIQNPPQTPAGPSREALVLGMRLMNDPRTPQAMKSMIANQISQQMNPKREHVDLGNEVGVLVNGKIIERIPKTLDPKTVTVGNTVVDVRTRQPIFQGQPSPTNDIQNFEYSNQHPGFAEFSQQQRRAGAQSINIDQKAESEFSKTASQGEAKRFNEIITQGQSARQMVSDLQTLTELGGAIQTGKGAQAKAILGPYAQALGVKVDGLSDIQAFEALVSRIAPSMRPAGSGTTSDTDLALYLKGLPGLGKTPEGNALIAKTNQGLYENQIKAAEIASQAVSGKLDRAEAEKQLRELPDPMEAYKAYRKEHPSDKSPSASAATPDRSALEAEARRRGLIK